MTAQASLHYPAVSSGAAGPLDSFWISLRYFALYRVAVAALFLGITAIYGDGFKLGSHDLRLFIYVVTAYLLLSLAFLAVMRGWRERFNMQLTVQVCADIVAMTLLMYASGGIRSGLGVMVLISLLAAALVAPARLAFLYAALATIALLLEQSYWVLFEDAPEANFLQPGLLALSFFVSAGTTNWLAQRVAANESLARRRSRELETQTRVNQLVIADMYDGFVVLDGDGVVVQHNPQARRLIGDAQLLGARVERLIPELGDRWRAAADPLVAGPAGIDLELRGRGVRVRRLDLGEQEDVSVLFIEDTSRAREQARQLKLAALGRLTANIAHEIRNPLAAISHAAELLGEEKREDGRERLTRIIRDNTRRLERLVSDVLQLNRRDRISSERIALDEWLGEFLAEFVSNEEIPVDRIVLGAAAGASIEFDSAHLHQVMWNLLRNALRYARPEPGAVRLTTGRFGHEVELNVADNGPGVDAENQSQLFEPFFTTDSKGTGLGLYLARELCVANGAQLDYVDDLPGAHFRIRFRRTRYA